MQCWLEGRNWIGKGAQATGMTANWTVARWSKVLFSDESKFCISFVNQGPRVWRKRGEAQNPCCLRSSVKFPQSVIIWAAMSSAGVGPLYFLKTNIPTPVYQEILEHFMLPSADQLYGDADFIFQQDSAPAHTAKGPKAGSMTMVLLCLIGQQTRLTWTPENLDERHQTQQCRWPEEPVLHYTWAVPQADCLHATPHWCSNSGKRRLNHVLSA